jgi:S-adenosylmethionine synthetase
MQISSESIKVGHPDIVADVIAANVIAEILDEEKKLGLTLENMPHCGIEVFLGKGICLVGGEVRTRCFVDIDQIARKSVLDIGYNHAAVGLNGHLMGVLNAIIPQSDDINQGTSCTLNKDHEIGAGDQGIMYGFACNETPELLPLPYVLVSKMMRAFEDCGDPIFAPDGKGQVSVEYDGSGRPVRLAKVLMSNAVDYRFVQGSRDEVRERARQIAYACLGDCVDSKTEFLFNPTGEWQAINSCSAADSGGDGSQTRGPVLRRLSRRPAGRRRGWSTNHRKRSTVPPLSEPVTWPRISSPPDSRPNVPSSWLYAIGIARPFSVYVNTYGTGVVPDERLEAIISNEDLFDLTPAGMIQGFDLLNGDIYRRIPKTFFMDDYLWEKTDKVEQLKKAAARA